MSGAPSGAGNVAPGTGVGRPPGQASGRTGRDGTWGPVFEYPLETPGTATLGGGVRVVGSPNPGSVNGCAYSGLTTRNIPLIRTATRQLCDFRMGPPPSRQRTQTTGLECAPNGAGIYKDRESTKTSTRRAPGRESACQAIAIRVRRGGSILLTQSGCNSDCTIATSVSLSTPSWGSGRYAAAASTMRSLAPDLRLSCSIFSRSRYRRTT